MQQDKGRDERPFFCGVQTGGGVFCDAQSRDCAIAAGSMLLCSQASPAASIVGGKSNERERALAQARSGAGNAFAATKKAPRKGRLSIDAGRPASPRAVPAYAYAGRVWPATSFR